ncbi:MAG: aldolase/citrate lyase family protein [bacterium]|nr:aldolase/citrate lyase family protein [bacterium]
MTSFTSGNTQNKSDCRVEFTPETTGGLSISVNTKVEVMYGDSIRELSLDTLHELGIEHGTLQIDDAGALPFVIMARIEAVVKTAFPDCKRAALPEWKEFCRYKSSREHLRRSRLYIPGNQPKLMLNAGLHKPDGIILDLEDSVAPPEKLSARFIVRNALRVIDFFGVERLVRVNQGALGLADLEEIVPHNVHLILLPKIETADQMHQVDAKIAEVSKRCGRTEPVFLMPIIESALGILNALSIATASPNNVALAIGLEDYTADLGTQRTLDGKESFFARSMIINAARAAGLQPIDTVYSDVADMVGLRKSVEQSRAMGFDGIGCIHPRQIAPINEAFTPTEDEISKAKRIVVAFDDAQKRGLGVVSLGSKMIDPPVVKRAVRTIDMAVAYGKLAADWKQS